MDLLEVSSTEHTPDPVLCQLRNVIESAHGPMLVYDWASGELIGAPRSRRDDDLDLYRAGPFVNDMGRMFGSTRFMAPEEFVRGAPTTR